MTEQPTVTVRIAVDKQLLPHIEEAAIQQNYFTAENQPDLNRVIAQAIEEAAHNVCHGGIPVSPIPAGSFTRLYTIELSAATAETLLRHGYDLNDQGSRKVQNMFHSVMAHSFSNGSHLDQHADPHRDKPLLDRVPVVRQEVPTR